MLQFLPALGLALAALGSPEPAETADRSVQDTRALFLEHCAKCHGENGDGQGVTELERPARSFLDGGYSYGNTREAVVRSIEHGIPGTAMPAFKDDVLTADKRQALADFVISLGPPGTVVEPGASVLRVGDRPVVVRGMLPKLAEGEPDHPRGLLIGFPNGMSFEYRADDVRLLAVRQGDFVDRRDWGDRGGVPLRPLGRIVERRDAVVATLCSLTGKDGNARAPLSASLLGTEVRSNAVVLRYELEDADRAYVGRATESLRTVDLELSRGYVRRIVLAEEDDPSFEDGMRLVAQSGLSAPKGRRFWEREKYGYSTVSDPGLTYRLEIYEQEDDSLFWHFRVFHHFMNQSLNPGLGSVFGEAVLVSPPRTDVKAARAELLTTLVEHPIDRETLLEEFE